MPALLGLGPFLINVATNEERFQKAQPPVQVATRCPALGPDIWRHRYAEGPGALTPDYTAVLSTISKLAFSAAWRSRTFSNLKKAFTGTDSGMPYAPAGSPLNILIKTGGRKHPPKPPGGPSGSIGGRGGSLGSGKTTGSVGIGGLGGIVGWPCSAPINFTSHLHEFRMSPHEGPSSPDGSIKLIGSFPT